MSDATKSRTRTRPVHLSLAGWKAIGSSLIKNAQEERLTLVAAGVTFYLVLAIFPSLAALVSIYGLFTDPALLDRQLEAFGSLAPDNAVDLLRRELQRFVGHSRGSFGVGLVVGVATAVWAVSRGVGTLIMAMNIVYEQDETRSFVHKLGLTLGLSFAALAFIGVWFALLAVAPVVISTLGLDGKWIVSILRWPILVLTAALGVGLIYRYGPNREPPSLISTLWGGGLALAVWIAGSVAFSAYIENFGNYDATYGSLAALAGMMTWIWMSAFVLLLGAQLNAEIEGRVRTGEPGESDEADS